LTSTVDCAIEFDDGTAGWIAFTPGLISTISTTLAFNSGTGTADEYGNYLQTTVPVTAVGIWCSVQPASNAADFELVLYSDPLGTPAVVEAITFDATMAATAAADRPIYLAFSTPRALAANTAYAITLRPTTANNVTTRYEDQPALFKNSRPFGDNWYAVRRLDNTGAFSDYNGGTAKTRAMSMGLMVNAFDDGTSTGGGGGPLVGGRLAI
jgi:hypothetical protein